MDEGVISPGGVGYDINCGVRLLQTNWDEKDILAKKKELLNEIFKEVPAGVGRKGITKLSKDVLFEVLEKGSEWAVKNGYGTKDDLDRTEENGRMKDAKSNSVSERALERGMPQLGTLGSGNHFLEIQKVDKIFNKEVAEKFGIKREGQICLMIHCGSRGLGHQVASDYIKKMETEYGIKELADRELVNAPIQSELGKKYYEAMACSVNYAFSNRQLITHWVRDVFKKIMGSSDGIKQVYDVCHNLAKFEKHEIDGEDKEVCLHRKGATRSFGPGREEIPEVYRSVGQPVIIPGSMGTASYLLVGSKKAEEISFGSTCFSGDTKILTDKGILTIQKVYEGFNEGESFLALSINENNLELEWKPILNSMKQKSNLIEIAVSQTNRSNQSTLKTTPDHKFITISNFKLIEEEINKIINENKSLCLIDQIPNLIISETKPEFAYLVGALLSDGSFYCSKRHGKVTFTQKKIPEKLKFIEHVQHCFLTIFDVPLREYREKFGGCIEGRQIFGSATDYVCCQKFPAITFLNIYDNLSSWIMSLNTEAVCQFLAGLVDGDGTWNEKRSILQIYTGDETVVGASLLACLKLGILPYISKQRKTCFIIQLSEKEDLILNYTKRINGRIKNRKYGQKLFSAKQLFNNLNVRWPYKHKLLRNNLMSIQQIKRHLHKYPEFKEDVLKLIDSPIRMQRVKKIRDVGFSDVYNIEVADNHNYIVFTDMFAPILVKNCHGAGRVMSRHEALRRFRGEKLVKELEQQGIYVKGGSLKGLAEEASGAYKNCEEVVRVSHELGIGNLVCKLFPLAVMKG